MATLPTQTKSFPPGNRWGISNGTGAVDLGLNRLVHAAVTAGHGQGWRQSIASDTGAQAELRWKASALLAAVCERNSPRGFWQKTPLPRLFPTDRLGKMDPSERRAASYHLGITAAVAWARKALRIPWLMHLDVYQQQLNVNLQPGNSRPDLVGRHADGAWTVFEAKGRSSAPNQSDETKAKTQSRRVVDIGGVAPSSCFAFFSFFATDPSAVGPKKPKVVHLRVIDPKPGGEGDDDIRLPELTTDQFFHLYYQPWRRLLSDTSTAPREGAFNWRRLEDLDFRVGMLTEVADALERQRYAQVPEIIGAIAQREGLAREFPDWAGDGLVIQPGESWKRLFSEE